MVGWIRHGRLVAGVLLVAVLLAVALWPGTVEVETAVADRGPLVVTVDEEGETRVRDRFVVSAPVAGHLERILLEAGDAVVAGQTVLFRIRPSAPALLDARTRAEQAAAVASARAAIGSAIAERDGARAALDRARDSMTRLERLRGSGAISRDELEAQQTAVRTAEESLRSAEFAVARSEHELAMAQARAAERPVAPSGAIEVIAPIDGVLLRRHRESEAVVPSGEPLVDIGDASRLEVVADLLSNEAVRVSAGDAVLIEQWGGERELDGRVRRVEPSGFMKVSALGVEEQRVNVIIDFDDPVEAGRHLGDAYRVEVRIVTLQRPDVLRVPVSGLFRHGQGWATFVVEGGRAALRSVEIGERNQEHAEVRKGLDAGETIVVHAPDTVEPGTRVRARGA